MGYVTKCVNQPVKTENLARRNERFYKKYPYLCPEGVKDNIIFTEPGKEADILV